MGCSNSKETALKELNLTISEMTAENEKLQKDCEKFKGKNDANPAEEKANLTDIQDIQKQFEKELKTLSALVTQLYHSSKEVTSVLSPQLKDLLEVESKLSRKANKVKKMIAERDQLREDQEVLERQIHESEVKIKAIENKAFIDSAIRTEHHNLNENVTELESQKEQLLGEMQKAEEVLRTLADEAKNMGFDEKVGGLDLSNYEVLLSLTDVEVASEVKKVDAELEELAFQIKALKAKESELLNLENANLTRSQSGSGLMRNESLKLLIKNSQERVDMLESEKNKVKEEISKLKRSTVVDEGISEKIFALNNIIEKKKITDEENGKVVRENLVIDIEETLKKARVLTGDLKGGV